MKTIKLLCTISLLFLSIIGTAQHNKRKVKREVKKILALGKDSIIQLAIHKCNNYGNRKEFDEKNFQLITVTANDSEVYVNFLNPVLYIPINKYFTFEAIVPLTNNLSCSELATNDDPKPSDQYLSYFPNNEENKKIMQFVFNAIKESDKSEHIYHMFNKINKSIYGTIFNYYRSTIHNGVRIEEKSDHYTVSIFIEDNFAIHYSSKSASCKVNKKTGLVYDITHKNYMNPKRSDHGPEESIFREILK